MKKNMTIYHGSINIIERPIYKKGNIHNDYGLGFYCTEDKELAKEWAVTDTNDGYANRYNLDLEGLKVLDLSKNNDVLTWITILLQNRVFDIKNEIAKAGKEYLISHFNINVSEYDVIIGYRADDSYFAFAEDFLNNTISVRRLSEALRLGNLGKQVVLISKKAFDQITFEGYEKAESTVYYPLRKNRNDLARSEFLNNRKGILSNDDVYLIDLIRGK